MHYAVDLDLTALRDNLLDSSRVEDMVKEYFMKIDKVKLYTSCMHTYKLFI